MVEITSIKNPKIKEIYSLYDKKERLINKKFIVEGYHLVEEASKHNLLCYIVSTNKDDFKKYQTDGYLVNEVVIKKLSTTLSSQGIIGVVKMAQYDIDDIIRSRQKFIILDNVNDPGNFGTIIRTAAAFGIDAIFVSNETVDLYNEKVVRATQGAIFKIPVIKTDLEFLISELKKKDVYIYGTSLDARIRIQDVSRKDRFAVVFGNEANGVRDEIKNLTNQNFVIPMKNDMESLNVAVACALAIYYLMN